ncbi:MAG TPA: UDP-N-acetylmuramoyl-tripeptide--D-alanyl-D-alanine ligase [Candidatus Faecisoma merdavium]|nr:UDP-N-acetylmuramoyl-tripeptide--D-alanyl-D-alanine ligase [Candidatus Faecisoma merdavium]
MKLSEINNTLKGKINKDVSFNKIKMNSKDITTNDVFLAINKGHNYIDEAINNGAVGIISEYDLDYPSIKVDNSILALGKIANYIRNLYDIPLIAITGSVGKTTTKELIYSVLSKKYKVLKSEKNKNNNIGCPLTLLNLDETYDIIVLEFGMNHFNEISYLSKICNPDYAIITNIGTAHIGNLGSKKNILKAKLEILDGMSNKNIIVNNKDKYLKKIRNAIKVDEKRLNVIYKNENEFIIDNVIFNYKYKHILPDIFIAIKVGLLFDINLKLISEAISEFEPIDGRLNIINREYKIIDDSYNSSYESLIEGLKSLDNNFKYIVLADMLELGKFSIKYHKKVNKYLKKIKNKKVLLIGNYTKYIDGIHFENLDELILFLKSNINKGDTIYIKGSRKFNLDIIKTRI